jgi:hypothetical protein
MSTTYGKRGVSNYRTSRSCPVFEKANMAKHHTQPPTGTMSSAKVFRLQAALNERGWTQSELARHMAPLAH